jgi:hypothetical protein
LNATGESDVRNYYDKLSAEQSTVLTPAMSVLDEVIIRSALGHRPPEIYYEWASLWQITEAEEATIALQKAQAFQIDANVGLIPTTALAQARINQLIEDGTYPGLQTALDDAAAAGESVEEFNKTPEPPAAPPPMPPRTGEIDPQTASPVAGNGGGVAPSSSVQ